MATELSQNRKMNPHSWRTAISRRALPKPTRLIFPEINRRLRQELTRYPQPGRNYILDYGCGRCKRVNDSWMMADSYDPHFQPNGLLHDSYDVVICNYVLNVIPLRSERVAVLDRINRLIQPSKGIAFITVRRNLPRGKVGWTSKGTWQGFIELNLPTFHRCSEFEIYRMEA